MWAVSQLLMNLKKPCEASCPHTWVLCAPCVFHTFFCSLTESGKCPGAPQRLTIGVRQVSRGTTEVTQAILEALDTEMKQRSAKRAARRPGGALSFSRGAWEDGAEPRCRPTVGVRRSQERCVAVQAAVSVGSKALAAAPGSRLRSP